MTPAHKDRGHSEFGGSGAARWMACSASILDARGLPPLPSSEAAEEGTKDHELAELLLKGGAWPADVDADRRERVQSYLNYVESLRDDPQWSAMTELVEEPVELNALAWGSCDYARVSPYGTGLLIDYKGGIKPVEVKDNAQLAFYAVCLAEKYDLDLVHCQIFQPKLGGASSVRTLNLSALRSWKVRFLLAIRRVQDGRRDINAGPHCKYCRVAGTCTELQRVAISEAQVDFAAPSLVPRSPATMEAPDLAKVLALADTIESWLKSVRLAAMEKAGRGEEVPGFKLVEGKAGHRKWTDEAKVVRAAIAAGVDPYERTALSPAKIEKELGKPKFKELLGEMVTQSPGSPTLVPLSDKRKALSPSAALDFAPVVEE